MNRSKYPTMVPLLGIALALTFTMPTSPASGVVSIPPSAFQATYNSDSYSVNQWTLDNMSTGNHFYAPVYLPQGATVTEVTLHYTDAANGRDATFTLQRVPLNGDASSTLAYIPTAGYAGYGAWTDSDIDYAVIDNTQYTYQLDWLSPADSGIRFHGAVIQYSFQTSLPAILRNSLSSFGGR